jgi:hypothetical protein
MANPFASDFAAVVGTAEPGDDADPAGADPELDPGVEHNALVIAQPIPGLHLPMEDEVKEVT